MKKWVGLLMLASMCLILGAAVAERPNVIVMITDDQGYGDLSCHGHPYLKTPNIDRLASAGVRLTDFHVAPVCTPTRAQLLTGMDAMHNGAYAWGYTRECILPGIPTMADVFAANGYATGHFGKWHLGDMYPYRPQDRGFQETVHHKGASLLQTPDYWNNDSVDDTYNHNGVWKQYKGYTTDVWFDETIRFIGETKQKGKPFFIYLPTNLPHTPLFVPEQYRERFAHLDNDVLASFFGAIENIDENVGRLDDYLKKSGLYENTIVIWMTDNGGTKGTKLYNAGMKGGKASYYDGGHRVPFFLRWPDGGLKAREIDTLTQCQDVLPTLMELCNLEFKKELNLDGSSLAPLMHGKDLDLSHRKMVIRFGMKPIIAERPATVLWNKWRLVRNWNRDELFNIADDPGQKKNVADAHPEITEAMAAHYDRWWEEARTIMDRTPAIPIGALDEPVDLTCFDWYRYSPEKGANVTQQFTVRRGIKVHGAWNVEVAKAGTYAIELRRWPKEADSPIAGQVPEHLPEIREGINTEFFFGSRKALPIKTAKLRFGDQTEVKTVKASDKKVVFELELEKGIAELEGLFLDAEDEILCGAYYAYVEYLEYGVKK
jgi:arylsulfatase A-like enzyme